ncbi:MAG TPA: BadF/BadG/BcrA/BcrD ATPase family protein [Candidatus Kapabacteria bacterium]|nr:BadF/BadG/BcrA/BcrD ATPase family protein [Candidatus Kapabacteria bacterium]
MKAETYLVGIDGGGTHTRIRIADANGKAVIERSVPYTSKFFLLGFDEAAKRITKLIIESAKKKKLPLDVIRGVCVGLAGNGRQSDQDRFRKYLQQSFAGAGIKPRTLRLESDATIALEGLLAGSSGVVLICGTGAIAIGKTKKGEVVRVGGWGRIIGDEGSGYWIGVQALNAIARSLDGRAGKTMLTKAVFDEFTFLKKREPRELRSAIYMGKLAIEKVAPLVSRCAARGDAAAKKILAHAAEELCDQLGAMHRNFFSHEKNVRLVLHGSVLDRSSVGPMLKVLLAKRLPGIYTFQSPYGSPLDGAIRYLGKR